MSDDNMIKLKSYVINTNYEIGRGQYGVVYECQDLDNPQLKLCAKIINERLEDPKTKREMDLMKTIMNSAKGNKNIVGVEYVHLDDDRIILIMEKCECDLQSIIDKRKRLENKNFQPTEALNILKQIVNGYKVLHSNNIIHRDLKPANILVLDGVYKIADLGLARVLEANTNTAVTKVGTPKYVAPQLYLENFFTNSADIFSLGIITYELIFGGLPYVANSQLQVKKSLKNLEKVPVVVKQDHPGMTKELALLIEGMLKFKEPDRISWVDLFEHPLILEGKAVVNQSGFIKEGPEEEEEEEPVQEQQKPAETPAKEQQQQVPPRIFNQPIPTFTAPMAFPQMNKPMNPVTTIPPQFQQGKFSTPQSFVPLGVNQQKVAPFPPQRFQTGTAQVQPTPVVAPPFNTANAPVNNTVQPFQFQQVQAQSDQLYQAGVVIDQVLDSLERYVNMQLSLKQEWFGLKLNLHCFSQCFFEHAKVLKAQTQNQQNPNQPQFYTLANVEQAIEKQQRYHQVISQELERHQINQIYPVMAINPDYNNYLQKLKYILQTKGLFQYQPDKKYYVEYLQLLYFLERLKEQKEPFEDIYSTASDTYKNQRVESVLIDYLNKRFTL
ncbi:unnamed protein product [Paramecium octaurelia]|uniref:Protein kinase domain-containing protein n=1 Tax=Paramecium octaurelia TaxID=43137 RepID=A0A8S1XA74_PAROT|nr:unnamed protein product [Paramecium octaurelia]